MEAAWASAYRGGEAGLKFLARLAADPRHASTAQKYLEELGRADIIPDSARDPDFQAMAEMSNWLSHPNEFGRPPTSIDLYDARELFWPPTNDKRRVWLFRYRYAEANEDGSDDIIVHLFFLSPFLVRTAAALPVRRASGSAVVLYQNLAKHSA